MNKNKNIGCLSLLLLSPLTLAMQPMDDQSLSSTTGQDGINIGVGVSRVEFKQAALIDNDGLHLPSDLDANHPDQAYIKRAGLVMAGTTAGTNVALNFLGADANPTVNIEMDTDAGTGNHTGNTAFANVRVSFDKNITGIKLSPFSVYMAGANSLSIPDDPTGYKRASIFTGSPATLASDVKELLRVGEMQINFADNNNPSMNIQLGDAPQSHMIMFDGAIKNICGAMAEAGCNMKLVAENDVGISFDFQMNGSTFTRTTSNGVTTISHTESPFSLKGFYAGIEANVMDNSTEVERGGVVFGNKDWSDQFDLRLKNLTLGEDGAASATTATPVFNHLPNASMGNIGMVGAKIENFKAKVSGM